MHLNITLLGLTGVILLAGCSSGEENRINLTRDEAETAITEPAEQRAITDEQWAELIMAQHTEWQLATIPPIWAVYEGFADCGTSRLPITYERGPHNSLAYQVAVNPTGYSQFKATDTPLPVGTVIVKEKYTRITDAKARQQVDAIGVMTKREPGYDITRGNWEYGYIDLNTDGQVETITRGRIMSCIDCHSKQADQDYLFRSYPLMPKPTP